MIDKIKYRIHVLKKIYPLTDGVRKLFVINFIFAIFMLLLALALPVFYSLFIEKVMLERNISFLIPTIAGYILIQLMNTASAFLRNYCQYRVKNQVTVRMKEKILNNLLKRPFVEYEKINVGEQKMIMDDAVMKMCDFANAQTAEYIINYCKMVILLCLLLFMEWRLAIILVIGIPVTFWLNHVIGKKEQKNGVKMWENDEAMGALLYDSMNGWREIRALNLEQTCENRFITYADTYCSLFMRFIEYWVARVLIIPKIKDEFLMQFLLYFFGGLLIFNGNITIGVLLVFAQYFSQLVDTVQSVVNTDTDLQVNTHFYDKAIAAVEEVTAETNTEAIEDLNGDIVFENVSFSYEGDPMEIFHDFSLEIRQGERVGIVGESGKGKTTLLKLIAGMLEPTGGSILFGGKNLQELPLESVHKKIGFVLQENRLFNTTISENLLYGKEDAAREEMVEACRRAYIDEFISGLPDGYETVIGEKGIKLSGGQKQRLVLARLFLRDADLFIFDEATSALDQNAENEVHQAIGNIGRDKTIIIVSHRKSSLNLCERIMHL